MIQAGKHITTQSDTLQKLTIAQLYHSILHPKPEIIQQIRQLRIVRNIDAKQYALLKRQLPYFVCGIFSPAIRRTEHFAYIEYFVVDIDHIEEKGFHMPTIRAKVEQDEQVMLSFLSPSEDGLKLLFKLNERCYDAGIFSVFYRKFLSEFSKQYGLEQVVDIRTSDVTRACFISIDPQVYYNENATPISLQAWIDVNNSYALFSAKKEMEALARQQPTEPKEEKPPLEASVISQIKTILGTARPKAQKPPVYVPELLEEIIVDLVRYITEMGIAVKEVRNIQYAKKITACIGLKEGEVNLFYGKRGFSVVQSPRSGTSPEMNEILSDVIHAFLDTYQQT